MLAGSEHAPIRRETGKLRIDEDQMTKTRVTPAVINPAAWIVDVDGTLALRGDGPDVRGPFDWERVDEDSLNLPVARLVWALAAKHEIIIVSGRDECCRRDTALWLYDHGIYYAELYMRPHGDRRPDVVVKREIYTMSIAPSWRVLGVIDDRDQVVHMWRDDLNLMCAQIAYGNF